jgi:hypothetical protein
MPERGQETARVRLAKADIGRGNDAEEARHAAALQYCSSVSLLTNVLTMAARPKPPA